MKKVNIFYKKIVIVFLAIFFVLTFCGFDSEQQKVYDDANLLSDSQESTLQSEAVAVAEQLKLDVIIHTTDDTDGKETYKYAEDYYNNNDFGYTGNEGVIFVIDMENRNIYIYYSEDAKGVLSDTQTDAMVKEVFSYVKNGDYYEACKEFLDVLPEYADGSFKSDNVKTPSGYEHYDDSDFVTDDTGTIMSNFGQYWFIYLVIAMAVSTIIVGAMAKQQKTGMVASGNTYLKNDINIRNQSDRFTHTTVVTRVIEQNHDNGGGHTGSGGGHSSGGGSGAHF